MTETEDRVYLQKALVMAELRKGFCAPNPSVGAVIVKDNIIIATGHHEAAGHAHAEIAALETLNHKAHNATLYVTLEPCCHWGKTPPCTEALIQSGIKRVVYAYKDPNPIVAGKGEAILLKAGLQCEHIPLPEINTFYKSYAHWHQTQTPFVTAKIAMTLDGKIAGKQNSPLLITGDPLKELTHHHRKKTDAILTTSKTIIQDNPQLNARFLTETVSKPLYILDSQLNLPLTATIFSTAKSLVIFHAKNAPSDRLNQLLEREVRCYAIAENRDGLSLPDVLLQIGKDGVQDLWIEAGAKCFSAFIQHKLLQRILIYMAPWIVGEGSPAFNIPIDFRAYPLLQWQQFGKDVLCEIDC